MASGLPALVDPNTVTSEPKKFEEPEEPPPKAKEQFRESLGQGIPVEGGKRSVFGFGLSGEQEDALYDYLATKGAAARPPGYEPDRAALAECWGSPTPPNEPGETPAAAEDAVEVASTESLYEGEGGVDLGARSAEEEPRSELADRLLIVQKVKECYGAGVKTSLERVLRYAGAAGDGTSGAVPAAPQGERGPAFPPRGQL